MKITRRQLNYIIKESLKDVTPKQKRATAIEAGYLTLQPSLAALVGIPAITTGPVIPQDRSRKEDEIVDQYYDPDNPPVSLEKDEELDLDAVDLHDTDPANFSSDVDIDLDIDSRGV